jgi:hypothetical protein
VSDGKLCPQKAKEFVELNSVLDKLNTFVGCLPVVSNNAKSQ